MIGFLVTAKKYSKLFGEVGAKTGTGKDWSKKDARRANTPPQPGSGCPFAQYTKSRGKMVLQFFLARTKMG